MNTKETPSAGRRRPRIGRLAVGVVLIAVALGYLVYAGTRDNLVYYYEVGEVQAAAAKTDGKIRISGDVVEGSIARDEAERRIRFSIRSASDDGGAKGGTIPVVYSGTVPDIFREGIQVVVEGRLGEDGTFEAETLLAKCPSKYQEAGQLSGEPKASPRS